MIGRLTRTAWHGWGYVFERNLLLVRRYKWMWLSGLAEPVLVLVVFGVGVRGVVGEVHTGGASIDYLAFLVPGLIATATMNAGLYESTPVFFKLKYGRTYHAMLATSLTGRDVVIGEASVAALRAVVYAVGFVVVSSATRATHLSVTLPLVIFAAALGGFAFGSLGLLVATLMRSWPDFDLLQVAIVPMTILSGVYYPVDGGMQVDWALQLLPLYHLTALMRDITSSGLQPSSGAHALTLLAMAMAAIAVASARLQRRAEG